MGYQSFPIMKLFNNLTMGAILSVGVQCSRLWSSEDTRIVTNAYNKLYSERIKYAGDRGRLIPLSKRFEGACCFGEIEIRGYGDNTHYGQCRRDELTCRRKSDVVPKQLICQDVLTDYCSNAWDQLNDQPRDNTE